MALDVTALTDEVATLLGVSTSTAGRSVEAAIQYVTLDTGVPADTLEDTDALLRYGLILLAQRIYQDTPNLGGETNQLAPTFAGIYTPARLYSHLDEYWRHLNVNFGIA